MMICLLARYIGNTILTNVLEKIVVDMILRLRIIICISLLIDLLNSSLCLLYNYLVKRLLDLDIQNYIKTIVSDSYKSGIRSQDWISRLGTIDQSKILIEALEYTDLMS
jgi:hypothetical protein